MTRPSPLAAAKTLAPIAALALATALSACATAPVVDASHALAGHDLETANALYGRYQDRARIGGKDYYLWRRAVQVGDQSMVCELRVELGFRNMVRSSIAEGYPAACDQFSVRFTAAEQPAREKPAREPASSPPCKTCQEVASRETGR